MVTNEPYADDYKPTIPAAVRTVTYYLGVAITFFAFVVSGTAALVMEDPLVVVGVSGLIGTGFGLVAASLGVAYRPTK